MVCSPKMLFLNVLLVYDLVCKVVTFVSMSSRGLNQSRATWCSMSELVGQWCILKYMILLRFCIYFMSNVFSLFKC